ncbi:flagellar biosynthesis protein FlhB [Piscinibacter terrae]|uniref:Flagellar biosynthetic protein FlhB n=1 Tax=Piscinibacter terrae TaxID=2496871 RepID=A0A3N7HTW2_9BURK|nr:flagellar biosynthesis protein FlhB [Albitalea terrae]RQP25233.1 flagellar biosynthesis protein FlhB [Albitalea terrae]
MADDNGSDRNLPASQRKLEKAREEGQVARSRDLGHFAAIAGGGAILVAVAPMLTRWLQQTLAQSLSFDRAAGTNPELMTQQLAAMAWKLMWVVIPLGVAMTLIAIAGSVLIGGWNWTLKPLMPKFEKLNPIAGLPRLFSKQQMVDALKACALALVLGGIGFAYLRSHIDSFAGLITVPLPAALSDVGSTILGGLVLLLIALAICAAIDAPLQRYMHMSRLKMSHAEMKQEHKEIEGNSEVKAKIKVRMREMSRRRMLAAVPKADLVVMNPTHYAVALKYDETRMGAPRVVAKGADLLAMTIRDTARANKVPVLQSPVLARALYAHAKIDKEIPAALFAAVAQVLAYVYQLRAALAGHAPMPGDLPSVHVPPELDPHNKPESAE